MKRSRSTSASLPNRLLGTTLAVALVGAPLPVLAAPPADAPPAEGAPAEAAPTDAATVGGNVAVLKFGGDPVNSEGFRDRVTAALEGTGYAPVKIKRSLEEAAEKNKCRTVDASCLEKIGPYLNKNSKTAFDFFVYGDIPASGAGKITVYDIGKNKIVSEIELNVSNDDYILPEVIGPAVATELAHYQSPAAPATDEEKALLATLDEPLKTQEEIDAEAKRIADAEDLAKKGYKDNLDAGPQSVDLKAEFKDFCRKGPREDREVALPDGTIEKERDLRPACSRGPVFGYWQPRAWVALTLTLGSAATMGVMYGLAAASRGDWKDARDELQASGLSATDPTQKCANGVCYEDLAGQVSEYGSQIRRRAIIGDVMLGTTVLLAGVLAVIIYQDRTAAKTFLSREKEMRAVSDLRIGPWIGQTNGAALGFKF